MTERIDTKVSKATIWSTISEFAAKLISPITSTILARLLTPEDFGVVAAINIIISFADMFTDAGFQKYIVQHEFKDDEEYIQSTNVAFCVNIVISMLLWIILIIFRYPFSRLVRCEDYANVLIIAGISLILTSFSSIQMATLRRCLDFKSLFFARVISAIIHLLVAVPTAFITHSFWALILGSISVNLANAIILTLRSSWKPKLFFDYDIFKKMFSFSIWTLCEQITIWLSTYICTFIVGRYLSNYYLGLFNNSMTTVNQFTTLLTSAFSPVLFSALSRLQYNRPEYLRMYMKYKRVIACFTVPLCVGIYAYKELIVKILLGQQWKEAIPFIGYWAISGAIVLVSQYTSEIYRSLGKPRLSTIVQIVFIIISVPVLLNSAKAGFEEVCTAQALLRFVLVAIHCVVVVFVLKMPLFSFVINVLPCYISAGMMLLISRILEMFSTEIVWQIISIGISGLLYIAVLWIAKNYREAIIKPFTKIIIRIFENKKLPALRNS